MQDEIKTLICEINDLESEDSLEATQRLGVLYKKMKDHNYKWSMKDRKCGNFSLKKKRPEYYLPPIQDLILSLLNNLVPEENRLTIQFHGTPVSTNALYEKKIIRNRRTGFTKILQHNTDGILVLRLKVKRAFLEAKKNWNPSGLVIGVFLFESPDWFTKDGEIRNIDLDNKFKSLLDALEKATEMKDSRIFQIFGFKVIGKVESTRLILYDLAHEHNSKI